MTRPRGSLAAGLAALALVAGCVSGCSHGSSPGSGSAPTSGTPTSGTTGPGAAGGTPSAAHPGPPPLHARVLAWQLPAPVSRAVAMAAGDRVVLAGGLGPGDTSTDLVLSIDLAHGVRGRPGHLAEALHDSAGAVLDGRPTVIGGGGATELSDVQGVDARGRWQVTGRLPGARSDLSVVTVGRRGFVVGGYDGASTPTSILSTTDGHTFRPAGTLPQGLRYSGVTVAHGAVWILGGEVDGRELDEVLRFDPRTGQVRRVGRLPRPLGHEAVVPVGRRLLVLGGRTAPHEVTDQMWWFSPADGSWTRAGRLPYPVADAPWVADGDAAYLLGGESPDFTARVTRVGWGR